MQAEEACSKSSRSAQSQERSTIREILISRTLWGHQILNSIIDRAQAIGVKRIFCLTFETQFFGRHGFEVIEGTPVEPEVYKELLRSYDAGVAEFLELESVKIGRASCRERV